MFTKTFLLCAVSALSVVTANPLLQTLVSQSCPICEQNALKSQIQNLLLQQTSNFQPNPQVHMNQNPAPQGNCMQSASTNQKSCSICQPQNIQSFQISPCNQQGFNQPYCPCPQQNVQSQNNLPVNINKILTNPTLRTILDPNTKLFNQNGCEINRNGPCSNGQPNVINNYFIVPPELLLEDSKSPNANRKTPEERKTKNRSNNSKVSGNSKPDINSAQSNRRQLINKDEVRNKRVHESTQKDNKRKHRRRQKTRPPELKVKVVDENETKEIKKIESSTIAQQQQEEDITITEKEITTEVTDNPVQTTTSLPLSQVTNDLIVEKSTEPPKTEEIAKEENIVVLEKPDTQQIQNQESVTERPRRKNNRHSKTNKIVGKTTNPREEAVIHEFRQKFPNIPEDVVRNLLDYMKRQLIKQNLGAPAFYYPQFPLSYDQLLRNQFANVPNLSVSSQTKKSTKNVHKSSSDSQNPTSNNKNRSSRRRQNRRNKNRRRKDKTSTTTETCDTTIELTPTIELATTVANEKDTTVISTTALPSTTALTSTTNETPSTILEDITEPITVVVTPADIQKIDIIETTTKQTVKDKKSLENTNNDDTHEVKVTELGTEDIVPTIYLNELDEYYPDFTEDHQYYSDEELSLIRFEDDRYHYTTDKNFELEELNRDRRRLASDTTIRRPPNRYLFKLINKDRLRSQARLNHQNKKANSRSASTTLRPSKEITQSPKITVTIESDSISIEDINTKSKSEENSVKQNSNPEEQEIQFRTPPTFETKQINKKVSFRDNDYKTSSYSDAKTPQYKFNKKNEKILNIENKQQPEAEIETVYANSKVAMYGKSLSQDVIEKQFRFDDENSQSNEFENNDDTRIVIAKSITGDYW